MNLRRSQLILFEADLQLRTRARSAGEGDFAAAQRLAHQHARSGNPEQGARVLGHHFQRSHERLLDSEKEMMDHAVSRERREGWAAKKETLGNAYQQARHEVEKHHKALVDYAKHHNLDPAHYVTPDQTRSASHHVQQLAYVVAPNPGDERAQSSWRDDPDSDSDSDPDQLPVGHRVTNAAFVRSQDGESRWINTHPRGHHTINFFHYNSQNAFDDAVKHHYPEAELHHGHVGEYTGHDGPPYVSVHTLTGDDE